MLYIKTSYGLGVTSPWNEWHAAKKRPHVWKKALTAGSVDPCPPNTLPRSRMLMPCCVGEGFVGKVLDVVRDSGSLPSVWPRDGGFMGHKDSVCMVKPGAMGPASDRSERIITTGLGRTKKIEGEKVIKMVANQFAVPWDWSPSMLTLCWRGRVVRGFSPSSPPCWRKNKQKTIWASLYRQHELKYKHPNYTATKLTKHFR